MRQRISIVLTCAICGDRIAKAFIHIGNGLACHRCLARDPDLLERAKVERERRWPPADETAREEVEEMSGRAGR